jgi:hypothetical protein
MTRRSLDVDREERIEGRRDQNRASLVALCRLVQLLHRLGLADRRPQGFAHAHRLTELAREFDERIAVVQFIPSAPDVIEPPETLDTRESFFKKPRSFSRQSAPPWNSIAR